MRAKRLIEVFRPVIYEDSINEAVKTLRSGWIGAGPRVKEFEERFSRYVGSKYCVAVNSGTSALHIALRCLNLPKKGEIVTTPITYVSTIHTIIYERCIPRLADVERETGNISVEGIKEKLTDDTKAILCVHLGGYPCDLDKLRDLASTYGIPLIEDCAHAIGSSYKGESIGTGTLCCFSFSFPKPVTGVEGGAIVTSEPEYAERARILRNLGIKNEKERAVDRQLHIKEVGFRYNWNDVMASIALKQLDHLELDNRRRKQIAERYLSELSDTKSAYLPRYKSDRNSSYFFVPLFFDRRDDLARKLYRRGIRSKVYFRRLDAYYDCNSERLPNADWYGRHELTLPINVCITDEEIDYILKTIRSGW